MKRLILFCSLFLLSLSAFAQTDKQKIEDQASFLSTQMDALLNLDTQQKNKINRMNVRRYAVEDQKKSTLANDAVYQEGVRTNFEGIKSQNRLQKINEVIAKAENRYDMGMQSVLTPAQYEIYLSNKEDLLRSVTDEFGE